MASNQTTLVIGAEDRTAAAFRSIRANMDSLQSKMETFRNAAIGIGGAYVLSGLTNMMKHSLEAVDAIGKLAQKTGIATEELSALSYAAKLSDVSTESLTKGIKSLSQRMTEAVDPASKAAKIMTALGVDINKGAAAGIDSIANAFAKLPDGTTKAALAVELFGKAGMDMVPLLNQGAEGIKRMKEEAERFGLIVDERAAKSAEAFNDNMKALTSGSQKLGIEIINQLGPAMVRITDAMKDAAAEGGLLKAVIVGIGGVITELATGSKIAAMTRNLVAAQEELAKIESNQTTNPVAMVLRGQRITELQAEIDQWKTLIAQQQYSIDLQRKRATVTPPAPDKALESQIRNLLGGPQAVVGQQLLLDLEKQLERLRNEGQGAETERMVRLELTKDAYKNINEEIKQQIILKSQEIDLLKQEEQRRQALDIEHKKDLDFKDQSAERLKELSNSWQDATFELEQEARLIGLSNVDRQKAILLEKARLDIVSAGDNAAAIRDINANLEAQLSLLAQINDAQTTLNIWDRLSDSAGRFFSDVVLSGRDAFRRLGDQVRQFAAELLALFAKRWVLQMVASATGSSALSAAASNVGANSLAGTLGNALLGSGTLGSFMGGFNAVTMAGEAGAAGIGASGILGSAGEFAAMAWQFAAANPAIAIAAVVAIVVGVISQMRRGGPKDGGSFFGAFDASGNLVGETPVPGYERFYTPSGGDSAMRSLSEGIGSAFAQTLTRLGGTGTGMGFGFGFDRDPRGTAASRVSGIVTDASGRSIFSVINREAGRSEEDLQAAIELIGKQSILAALQNSQLPEAVQAILRTVDAASASSEQIDAVLKLAEAFVQVQSLLSDISVDDVIRRASMSSVDAFHAQGTALLELANRSSLTTESLAALAQATGAYRQNAEALIVSFEQARRAIAAMFEDTRRNILMSGLDEQGRYNFLQTEGARLFDQLQSATTADEISRITQLINRNIGDAFGMLSPEDQARMRDDFLTRLDSVNANAQERLRALQEQAAKEANEQLAAVRKILEEMALGQQRAADTQVRAADTQLVAANTRRELDVRINLVRGDVVVTDGG